MDSGESSSPMWLSPLGSVPLARTINTWPSPPTVKLTSIPSEELMENTCFSQSKEPSNPLFKIKISPQLSSTPLTPIKWLSVSSTSAPNFYVLTVGSLFPWKTFNLERQETKKRLLTYPMEKGFCPVMQWTVLACGQESMTISSTEKDTYCTAFPQIQMEQNS